MEWCATPGNSWVRPASIGCLHRLFSHAIRYIARTPVVEYIAPTPIVCTAPTPVVEYIDLITAVSCVAPALVVEYVACSGFRYLSNIVPVVSLGFTMLVAHSLRDMFGVAFGTQGMLGTLTMGLTIDAWSFISGLEVTSLMSQLDEWVRGRADVLDAEVAIGKGFAIGSAGLVSLALFGTVCVRVDIIGVDFLHRWVFTGLLFGAMMPYELVALTMKLWSGPRKER